jgi:hypothetical protein
VGRSAWNAPQLEPPGLFYYGVCASESPVSVNVIC